MITLVIVLGILIFIHELGHFIVAKWLSIRVNVFSLGFGPRLFGFKWRETDYRVSIIPLGGYVRMAGEHYEDHDASDKSKFLSRSKFQRFFVLAMGSIFNIFLCIILMTLVYLVGIEVVSFPEGPITVGYVEKGSPGAEANIMPGDKITEINARKVNSFSDFEQAVILNPNTTISLLLERNGELIIKQVNVIANEASKYREGYIGIFPVLPPVVEGVFPHSPAEKSGLKKGDRIIQVGGQEIDDYYELKDIVSENAGKPLILLVEREGNVLEKTMTPDEEKDEEERGTGRGFIGVYPQLPSKLVKKNLPDAFLESLRFAKKNAVLIFIMVKKLIRRELSLRVFSGPIEIAAISRQSYQAGMIYFISLIAIISLNLGIINLMPIPALDGGHILILLIEGVMRRDLSNRVKEIVMQIGLIFLILLMAAIIYFDIIKNVFS
jgi:regulator of sigma E protease